MDVLEINETFEEFDGCFQFAATLVVFQADNNVYHAVSKARYSSSAEIRAEHLTNVILVLTFAYSPTPQPDFTRAPDPLPFNSYVKKPRLISYDQFRPNHIADSVLVEVEACEVLRRHPHPNIATYLGCQISDGRITGICFAKYHGTLMEAVNPGNYMKRKLRSIRQEGKGEDYHNVLEGVKSGIQHLYSLGFIYNDINPSNIMLYNDTAVIIDFESCRR
jgi:serine/threonine protein kinase